MGAAGPGPDRPGQGRFQRGRNASGRGAPSLRLYGEPLLWSSRISRPREAGAHEGRSRCRRCAPRRGASALSGISRPSLCRARRDACRGAAPVSSRRLLRFTSAVMFTFFRDSRAGSPYAASMLVLLARLQPGPVAPDLVQVVGGLQAALAKLGHGLGRADLGEPPCDPVRNNVEVAVYLEAVVVGAPGLPSDVERQVLHH